MVEPTPLKNMIVKLGIFFPRDRVENKKCLSCHQPDKIVIFIFIFPAFAKSLPSTSVGPSPPLGASSPPWGNRAAWNHQGRTPGNSVGYGSIENVSQTKRKNNKTEPSLGWFCYQVFNSLISQVSRNAWKSIQAPTSPLFQLVVCPAGQHLP